MFDQQYSSGRWGSNFKDLGAVPLGGSGGAVWSVPRGFGFSLNPHSEQGWYRCISSSSLVL
jgi:hypothetical protein